RPRGDLPVELLGQRRHAPQPRRRVLGARRRRRGGLRTPHRARAEPRDRRVGPRGPRELSRPARRAVENGPGHRCSVTGPAALGWTFLLTSSGSAVTLPSPGAGCSVRAGGAEEGSAPRIEHGQSLEIGAWDLVVLES